MKRKPLFAAKPGILASIVASPGFNGVTTPSFDTSINKECLNVLVIYVN